jgi:hypothetical protein
MYGKVINIPFQLMQEYHDQLSKHKHLKRHFPLYSLVNPNGW